MERRSFIQTVFAGFASFSLPLKLLAERKKNYRDLTIEGVPCRVYLLNSCSKDNTISVNGDDLENYFEVPLYPYKDNVGIMQMVKTLLNPDYIPKKSKLTIFKCLKSGEMLTGMISGKSLFFPV
jgi:hypothetical protein